MAFLHLYSIRIKSDHLEHHGIKGQQWGIRNGPPYPLDSDALAKKLYSNAKTKEPKITREVSAAAALAGAKMYGLSNRLKTKESLKRKIETKAEEDGTTVFKAANKITDAVRYTAISSEKDFVGNYEKIKSSLEERGYKEVKCKNYFSLYKEGKVKHKSVQSVFKDEDGYKFEIQFHTPKSQSAKDKKVPLYEERRQLGLAKERERELEDAMVKLAEMVSEPKNIDKIKSH